MRGTGAGVGKTVLYVLRKGTIFKKKKKKMFETSANSLLVLWMFWKGRMANVPALSVDYGAACETAHQEESWDLLRIAASTLLDSFPPPSVLNAPPIVGERRRLIF